MRNVKYVPAESVYAIFEVKAGTKRRNIKYAGEKHARFAACDERVPRYGMLGENTNQGTASDSAGHTFAAQRLENPPFGTIHGGNENTRE